jgi:glucokinase
VSDSRANIVGVDIGGTKIAAGVVGFPEGKLLNRKVIPTLAHRTGEEVLADAEQIINEVIARAGQRVEGIGLGVCEIVDREGELASACSLPWRALAVKERLGKIAPAVIEADVRAAALAEARFGAGSYAEVFLYVTIGTGISLCLMIDGEPFRGARGATGTMASGIMPGGAVSLEQIASGPALVQRFRELGGTAQTGQDVVAAAVGNSDAEKVVRSAGEAVGASIGLMINILDPELVILGGGLGLSEGLYRDALLDGVRRHTWWEGHRNIPVVSAATGRDAGIIGAAAAFLADQELAGG